jgi:hypothetical protein
MTTQFILKNFSEDQCIQKRDGFLLFVPLHLPGTEDKVTYFILKWVCWEAQDWLFSINAIFTSRRRSLVFVQNLHSMMPS